MVSQRWQPFGDVAGGHLASAPLEHAGADLEEALGVDDVGQLLGHDIKGDGALGVQAPLRVDQNTHDGAGAAVAAVAALGQRMAPLT